MTIINALSTTATAITTPGIGLLRVSAYYFSCLLNFSVNQSINQSLVYETADKMQPVNTVHNIKRRMMSRS